MKTNLQKDKKLRTLTKSGPAFDSRAPIVCVILLFFITIPGFSQNQNKSFITTISEEKVVLNKGQLKKLSNMKMNPVHKNIQFIRIGKISNIAKANNGALPIKIPGSNRAYVARPTKVEYVSETNYTWKGRFIKAEGGITIICQKGEIFGHLKVNGIIYEIQSFEKVKNILVEYDNRELSSHHCGVKEYV